MSLNGLDAPAVHEAYQYAIAESGGWFLLKYVTRDSVELYERGKGGVNEARVAVSKYEERSPLYGLIIYRRRKVLIKYVPDGTSRLLQARTAVHFQDVLEKYSPYETLLEIDKADSLSDTSLAAVFPLHTASPAISSNRLNEISEDAEDDAPSSAAPTSQPPSSLKSGRERRAERAMRSDRQRAPRKASSSPPPSIQVNGESSPSTPLASPKSTISQILVREESGHRSISSLGTPSMASATEYAGSDRSDTNTEPESAPPSKPDLARSTSPPSTESKPSPDTRSSMKPLPRDPPGSSDLHTADEVRPQTPKGRAPFVPETRKPTGMQEKPQIISPLAPVPATTSESEPSMSIQSLRERNEAVTRPSTDKPPDDDPYDLKKYDYLFKRKEKLGPRIVSPDSKKARPSMPSVAAIPSNIKPPPPKKDSPVRPKSQGPATIPISQLPAMPAPPPIPDIPEYTPRPVSRGSVKSLPSHKSTAMTPDKLRLMKAIELRKKQMRKSQGAELTGTPKFDTADAPEMPKLPEQPPPRSHPPQEQQQEEEKKKTAVGAPSDADEAPSKKADSGIEMDYDDTEKREDKHTLALLESPRLERIKPSDELDRVPEPSSPPPVLDQSNELTPKAEPVAPVSPLEEVPNAAQEDESGHISEDEPYISPLEPAETPTIVQLASTDNVEPSLDERQVFGQDIDRSWDESPKLDLPPRSAKRQNSDLAKRRRGYIEPLHLEEMDSEDDFAEEISTATVHEAKPMTVAKSPTMETFIRRPSGLSIGSESPEAKKGNALQRTLSGESRQDTPELYLPNSRETSPSAERHDPMAGLKRNVSSGISRRIQALADMSSRDPSPNGYTTAQSSRPLSPETSNGALSPRDLAIQSRGSLRPSRSRTSSFQKTARLSARVNAQQQQQAMMGGMYQNENAPVVSVHRDPATNRDSVSVTARIVRPATSGEDDDDGATPPADELQQSSYAINHPRPAQAELARLDTSTPVSPPPPDAVSPEAKRTSPSAGDPTATAAAAARTMHSSTRNHFGRHKPGTPLSPHPDDFPVPPASAIPKGESSTSLASAAEDAAAMPAAGTRTSRFFKRMSNLASTAAKRRSTAQGSVASAGGESVKGVEREKVDGAGAGGGGGGAKPGFEGCVVGNLNVQFPDSLLWKRRHTTLTPDGELCFSPPSTSTTTTLNSKTTKRFPLTDFKNPPYIPDLDRQELPFSMVLDFADGTSLQVACEDSRGLRRVLGVVGGYWGAWQG